ncbi:potassium-transporting ATPase subunit F [Halomonas sp. HNIBRBA4712]|uniref:potassium-transporting ATPase subunit F n=1 Tax=Halomonas sp. HNIBRBA4712 TaxID=3373087 RepID=UPI003746CB3F
MRRPLGAVFLRFLDARWRNRHRIFTPCLPTLSLSLRTSIKRKHAMNLLLLLIALGTGAYLFYALVHPERF